MPLVTASTIFILAQEYISISIASECLPTLRPNNSLSSPVEDGCQWPPLLRHEIWSGINSVIETVLQKDAIWVGRIFACARNAPGFFVVRETAVLSFGTLDVFQTTKYNRSLITNFPFRKGNVGPINFPRV